MLIPKAQIIDGRLSYFTLAGISSRFQSGEYKGAKLFGTYSDTVCSDTISQHVTLITAWP